MAIGYSLHIGLNKIDPDHYASTAGRLKGAENDALVIQSIAYSMGFINKILLSEAAKRENVIRAILEASQKLQSDDFFLLTYSGHGGLIPNLNNDPEPVGYDQTWCLFDAQLVDDEMKKLWTSFRAGVRILVITDCCFSGTILNLKHKPDSLIKILPPSVLKTTYEKNKNFYDSILRTPNVQDEKIKASVLLLASCKDNQESLDGPINSEFTKHLIEIWNHGSFSGTYQTFIAEISKFTPLNQVPQLKWAGSSNNFFLNSQPFKI